MCLAREPDHLLARLRKSRVLEALGKPLDALNEVCAHLLLERDRVQAKVCVFSLQTNVCMCMFVYICIYTFLFNARFVFSSFWMKVVNDHRGFWNMTCEDSSQYSWRVPDPVRIDR